MGEFGALLTREEAWGVFVQHFRPAPIAEPCLASDGLDRVLAREVTAPQALPAFVRSAVDGYALSAESTRSAADGAPASLDVVAEAPMGAPAGFTLGRRQAALVHTGGMVPPGADAVAPIEDARRTDSAPFGSGPLQAGFEVYGIEVVREVSSGDGCIQPGEDVRAGELILPAGHALRPQDIGGLLALGITRVWVARRPRVGILSQGDEVVAPDREPTPGQVRDINSHTLSGLTVRAGGVPLRHPIVPDRQDALDAAARSAFEDADVIVITGGSSVGSRDLTPAAIEKLGPPGVLVHGVAMRPGKPTILAVCAGKPVFGLPGNPVSCINAFQHFVTPAIRMLMGARPLRVRSTRARAARDIPGAGARRHFVRVRLEERDGETWAEPVFGQSNLIFTLVRSEGVVEAPEDSPGIAAGAPVTVLLD